MRVLGAINLNSLCKCSVFDFAFSEELFSEDNFFGSLELYYIVKWILKRLLYLFQLVFA